MKQRPRPVPPPPPHAAPYTPPGYSGRHAPYTPPPVPAQAATLPLPRLTRARLARGALRRVRWMVHTMCVLLVTTGTATVTAAHPTSLERAVGLALIITGSGTSGYHLHRRSPRP